MLHVHRAERADGLVDALRALLLDPLADPFAPEVVAVPARGMERWLTQRMSTLLGATAGRIDGVCANVEFPSPRRLVDDAVAAASGIEPDEDPWLPERATWPLLEVVEACMDEPWLHSLAVHLGAGGDDPARRARRLGSVRHVADLFDRYALHRPAMVRAWAGGADSDGEGRELPADARWQAELWRRLRDRIDQPSPAERLEAACERLRDDPAAVALPRRVSLFGLTRLPAGHLQVLRALATVRDVHLFLLHPSPALWQAVAEEMAQRPRVVSRAGDATANLPTNGLLASWGDDARELQLVLGGAGDDVGHHHPVDQRTDTLLARIQADVRADRSPPGTPLPGRDDERPLLDPGDRSVEVHACHGRARQVEVVRDAILHLLADDPTLEPRDVIVMCPDIEAFAPLIQASFGAGRSGTDDALPADVRPPDLPVRLADRALRQTNPVLGVVAQLLELAGGRLTASQVLDLADREPVRRRFGLDDDDLARLQAWVSESGVRWGLDAEHRKPFQLDTLPTGTWRFGLDRILTGVAMTEDEQRLFAGVLPLDDVESGSIDLAGRFAELVDRLRASLDALSEAKTVDDWAAAIATGAEALTATAPREDWQRAELQRLLDALVDEASVDGAVNATRVEPPELRALLAERLQGRPTRANFRTGHLTICTLVPMRSVPHRVVCLLGLDDGVFPRKAPRDGDDLMAGDPHVGERDPRTEDRQLLLDALLAAQDRLIVTYSGNDERTNTPRPPAVPVGELLDVVDASVRAKHGPARTHVVVRHPLQPFDPRNFARDALVPGGSWSFDPAALAGARALTGPRAQPRAFLAAPLPPVVDDIVECEDLVRFVAHPVRAFLRQRLKLSVRDFVTDAKDDLSVELDGLGKWGVGQRLLDARLAGVDGRAAVLAEIARGTLPPGVLGEPVVREVHPIVEGIATAAQELIADGAPPGSIDVRVVLAGDRSLSGTIPGVVGDTLRSVTYSKVAAKHRLTAWVRLLALTAADPERPFSAVTVGKAEHGPRVAIARITPPTSDPSARRDWALGQLATLVDLYDRGLREALPLYCASSAAYAAAVAAGGDPQAAGRKAWESAWEFDGEDAELEHQLVLGGTRTFDELLADPPRPDEQDWEAVETTRLGRYARRLWDGLLASEQLSLR